MKGHIFEQNRLGISFPIGPWGARHWLMQPQMVVLCLALAMGLAYWQCLPQPLFQTPLSRVIEDRQGELLSARIAPDGQWRMPAGEDLPKNYCQALLAFEDRRFYWHQGVDPWSLCRATIQNLRHGRIVSGGSTLTMQVIRLANGQAKRSWYQKLCEMIQATRLDLGASKQQILKYYAANAPFGGNVVGLEAAAWRYFAKSPRQLSWGEAALLAVLPNSPGLLHPGRNRQALLNKRNRLLDRLIRQGKLDAASGELAKAEPLPEQPHPLPQKAAHLLLRTAASGAPPRLRTSIDGALQTRVEEVAALHHRFLALNEIHNLAAIVADVETGEVLAYLGNSPTTANHGQDVDITAAPRSSGSILKPFLYGLALQEGLILPSALLPDFPININGYRPENFNRSFEGAVKAQDALTRSLNVPFVHLLRDFGHARFLRYLQRWGHQTLHLPASHYGLSLILGGGEVTLWDLCGSYASMARTLNHFTRYSSRYLPQAEHGLRFTIAPPKPLPARRDKTPQLLRAGAIWQTIETLKALQRPSSEGNWEAFSSGRTIAWKTGTSFGFRDAWAIGITPKYVVGVWIGNANGEGRPGLIGGTAAAPLLFDLFNLLPATSWFMPPYDDLQQVAVCRNSGWLAGPHCPIDTIWTPRPNQTAPLCRYHPIIHLDASETYQVNSRCALPTTMRPTPWFVLPPLAANYYRQRHPEYRNPPPLRPDCQQTAAQTANPMQLIYPQQATRILVPVELDGRSSEAIFEVAHAQADATIFWHLDERYIGTTSGRHQLALRPNPGTHQLTLVDQDGHRLEQVFAIVVNRKKSGND